MRLIDADEIIKETWGVVIKDMFHMTETVEVVSAIDIKEAPTVNAIPIEFIEKIIGQYNDWNEDVEPLLKLLEDWEKENAQRENSSPEL